nr:hypothetical protein [Tanacetum cinerariifolium]
MWETDSYKSHKDHMQLYETLEKLMNHDHSKKLAKDLAEAHKKKKKGRESPKTPRGSPSHQPPPPPPPAGPSRALGALGASGSSQVPPLPPPPPSTNQKEEQPATPEPAWSIPSSDVPVLTNNWASALASNYLPPPEDSLLAQTSDIATFMDWFCKSRGITKLKPQDLEGLAFEIVKVFHPDMIHLQYQMEECHKLLTDSVDDPILRPALSILKMKAAYYPDAVLEQMVPDQFWIEEECKYDIAAIAVRTHMRILSVVRIKVFSIYGYDYMKKIVLRRTNLNEHVITEQDFKYLYPRDFEDLYLLNLQDFQLGIEIYHTQLNLTKPRWDATGFEYKHDYTVIDSPRAITFRDRYKVQMTRRFNEIHKFSDGTLQQINEALDYRVKEFQISRMNLGLNMRFWTRKDVDRSKAFMFAIQKRLKTKRIFRNLESFVGGRVINGDYRLLKLGFNSLVYSFRALSTLRRFGLRTASAAARPCQGDSSEFYLITGILTVAAAGQRDPIITIKANIDVTVKEIREALTEAQVQIFKKTCFGHWLDISLKRNNQLLIHTLLTCMVDSVANELSFLVSEWVKNMEKNPFRNRVFPHIEAKSVKLSDVIAIFDKMRGKSLILEDNNAVKICLLIWTLEAIPVTHVYVSKEPREKIPRAFAWKMILPFSWARCHTLFVGDNLSPPLETLTPTKAESESDWWKTSLEYFKGKDVQSEAVSKQLEIEKDALSEEVQKKKKRKRGSSPPSFQNPTYDQLMTTGTIDNLESRLLALEGDERDFGVVLDGDIPPYMSPGPSYTSPASTAQKSLPLANRCKLRVRSTPLKLKSPMRCYSRKMCCTIPLPASTTMPSVTTILVPMTTTKLLKDTKDAAKDVTKDAAKDIISVPMTTTEAEYLDEGKLDGLVSILFDS